MTTETLIHADCLLEMYKMAPNSVDLVLCSPPYEAQREYAELKFDLRGQDWVDWARVRFVECCRVSRGLVAWVVEGRTEDFRWSATPALLMADLHRAGIHLRKPPIYRRTCGIPGSGGPDWLRNDYEFIICASGGRLPWSDNKVMGHPPKYKKGGRLDYRKKDGTRVDRPYPVYKIANPGNVIQPPEEPGLVVDCSAVGGGHMGSRLAHLTEAPFPEALAEFFIRSFCPPGGTVLDIFCGSGTTLAVAKKWGRNSIGIDIRESQIALTKRRLATVEPLHADAGAVAERLAEVGRSPGNGGLPELHDSTGS